MGYGNFKDLPGRTALDKILCDKAFNIGLASTAYKVSDKKSYRYAIDKQS